MAGVRSLPVTLDPAPHVCNNTGMPWHPHLPCRALASLFAAVPSDVKARTERLALDGTSPTVLLVDRTSGDVIEDAWLYHGQADPTGTEALVPRDSPATAPTSSLSKLLTWDAAGKWQAAEAQGQEPRLLAQADWLASLLTGAPPQLRFDTMGLCTRV